MESSTRFVWFQPNTVGKNRPSSSTRAITPVWHRLSSFFHIKFSSASYVNSFRYERYSTIGVVILSFRQVPPGLRKISNRDRKSTTFLERGCQFLPSLTSSKFISNLQRAQWLIHMCVKLMQTDVKNSPKLRGSNFFFAKVAILATTFPFSVLFLALFLPTRVFHGSCKCSGSSAYSLPFDAH